MRQLAFLLAGTTALLAAPVAAQENDFRLPPAPTPTPTVVGPVPDTPAPRPAPTPTPAPTPSASPSVPAPRATVPTVVIPAPSPTPTRVPPAPGARATPVAPPPAASLPAAPTPSPVPASPVPFATPSTAALPDLSRPPAVTAPTPSRPWWPWLVAAFALGALAAAGVYWLRRRMGIAGPLVVPEIERPRVPSPQPPASSAAEPVAAPAEPEPRAVDPAAEAHPLHIAIELRKLTLTLMNATLGYRLTLTNAGAEPLANVTVAADLVGAHGTLPREAQLAGPATELPLRHLLAGLAPGESGDVAGELRLPLSELRPIAQGSAQLFVPLARFRVGADAQDPRCFTLVAGQPSPSGTGAIQPVRLDHGPRIYDGLAGRAF